MLEGIDASEDDDEFVQCCWPRCCSERKRRPRRARRRRWRSAYLLCGVVKKVLFMDAIDR